MTEKKKKQNSDVISRLADTGEDAMRRLVEPPRRTVVQAYEGFEDQLKDVLGKLRAIDPLAARVSAIERRLDSLEKSTKTTASRASRRTKPPTHRTPTPDVDSGQVTHDPRQREEAAPKDASGLGEAQHKVEP